MKIVVLDAETIRFGAQEWRDVAALGELVLHDYTPNERSEVVERCSGAEIVLTNKVPLSAEVLGALPELRMIGVLATGYNVVDVKAAKERDVAVCNVPGYSTASVAQHTLALILELTNHVARHHASVYNGEWVKSRHFCYWKSEIRELADLTVGLVGFGDIGRRVGAVVTSLNARVIAHTRTPKDVPSWPGFAFVGRDELFAEADVVSLHCPLTPETERMIDAAALRAMKRDAILINTARGQLVDEAALARALNRGEIAGAGIDVVSVEPMRADNPLLDARNCIMTPHIAWAGRLARKRLLEITAQNVRSFIEGSPVNRVL
ncbi:MAG: D-2-hydroxyacid dehydrogenase [Opitutales bacterium]|nr:D-2-hydroxyacid dehydrogenase [Opitutales bacterium]